jgi:hypothetical protein
MSKFTKEYYKIFNGIVKKSFNELKKRKVFILESKFSNLKGMALRPLPWVYLIILNKDVRDKDINYKMGLIVHEISHLDLYRKVSWPKYLYEGILYLTSRKFRSQNEWETEMHAIKKGYYKEILHYSKDREDFRSKYGYMMPASIQEYANSLTDINLEEIKTTEQTY